MNTFRLMLTASCALALAACSTTEGTNDTASTRAATAINKDPYPSTYRPYPGAPTALVGATVFDGAGGRIEGGTVLFDGGKVVAVGGADLAIPAGYTRVDGSGPRTLMVNRVFIQKGDQRQLVLGQIAGRLQIGLYLGDHPIEAFSLKLFGLLPLLLELGDEGFIPLSTFVHGHYSSAEP